MPKHLTDAGVDALTRRPHHVVAGGRAVRGIGARGVRRPEARHSERARAGACRCTASSRTAWPRRARNPRIWFAYLLQFGSFGDRVVLGTFLTLRLQQAWLERNFSMADAVDRARLPFVAAMAAGLATALVVGALLDRVDRLRIGVAAMALGARWPTCSAASSTIPTAGVLHGGRGSVVRRGPDRGHHCRPDVARAGSAA